MRNGQTTTILAEYSIVDDISQLCVGDKVLAIGFVSSRKFVEPRGVDKILCLIRWNGKDWVPQQRFRLGEFINIPKKPRLI